jgi:hypothetical protein
MTRVDRMIREKANRDFELEGYGNMSLFAQFSKRQFGAPTILSVGNDELERRLVLKREEFLSESRTFGSPSIIAKSC